MKLLLYFTLPLLFFPKVNLITFGSGETAGIRIDDFVLAACFFPFLFARVASKEPVQTIEKILLGILGLSLVSLTINSFLVFHGLLPVSGKLHYALRIFEYFIFFYVGRLIDSPEKLKKFFVCFLGYSALLMLLQKGGIIGQFTNYGYISNRTDRIAGICSFPSEAGALLNILFAYFLFDKKCFSPTLVFALFALLTYLTGSRIALLGIVVIFSARSFLLLNKTQAIFLITAGAVSTTFLLTRSEGLFSFQNFELVQEVWRAIDTHYDPTGYEVIPFAEEQTDMSWWLRIHKWCYALKIYLQHPLCYLQGIGPGFATAGLDGGFIRILVEYGLIGLTLFLLLFRKLASLSPQLKWMTVALCLNMLFFDAYLAYKPMSFFFLASGCFWSSECSVQSFSLCEKNIRLPC